MKTITRDSFGFEYKNKKSKNSKVRTYFAPKAVDEVKNSYEVTETALVFTGENVIVRYGFKSGKLTIAEKIDPIFNKYGATKTVSLLETTVEKMTVTTFKEMCAAADAA
jgi:hypothetical protein